MNDLLSCPVTGVAVEVSALTVAVVMSSPACGRSDRVWACLTTTTRPNALRCRTGRRVVLARGDDPTGFKRESGGETSAIGDSDTDKRRNAAAAAPGERMAPLTRMPHRSIARPNRGAHCEGTALVGWCKSRHSLCAAFLDLHARPRRRTPARRALSPYRWQPAQRACAHGPLRAALRGFRSSYGSGGHVVTAEGAPPTRMAPQLDETHTALHVPVRMNGKILWTKEHCRAARTARPYACT
jgi:hypothetical protein